MKIRKRLQINVRALQVFTTEVFGVGSLAAVIFGVGWAGNSSLRRCKSNWTSVWGWL
jgi:hypothetical protein